MKWDITSGVASLLYDSPYHDDYAMCGNLRFNEGGTNKFLLSRLEGIPNPDAEYYLSVVH